MPSPLTCIHNCYLCAWATHLALLRSLCAHSFYTAQRRLDLAIDPWNALDPRNVHGPSQQAALFGGRRASKGDGPTRDGGGGGNGGRSGGGGDGGGGVDGGRSGGGNGFSSSAEMMHHIGWHSVLNLALSAHGVAMVGSFGSSWSQLTLSMMHRQHRAPIIGCSLRPGWKGDNMYTRFTPKGPPLAREVSPACRRAMVGLCKGGGKGEPGMMYEGWGITWNSKLQAERPSLRPNRG